MNHTITFFSSFRKRQLHFRAKKRTFYSKTAFFRGVFKLDNVQNSECCRVEILKFAWDIAGGTLLEGKTKHGTCFLYIRSREDYRNCRALSNENLVLEYISYLGSGISDLKMQPLGKSYCPVNTALHYLAEIPHRVIQWPLFHGNSHQET